MWNYSYPFFSCPTICFRVKYMRTTFFNIWPKFFFFIRKQIIQGNFFQLYIKPIGDTDLSKIRSVYDQSNPHQRFTGWQSVTFGGIFGQAGGIPVSWLPGLPVWVWRFLVPDQLQYVQQVYIFGFLSLIMWSPYFFSQKCWEAFWGGNKMLVPQCSLRLTCVFTPV